jgi:hypothetical protein
LDVMEKAKLYVHYIDATKDSKNIFQSVMDMGNMNPFGKMNYYFVHDNVMYVSNGHIMLKTRSPLEDGYYDKLFNLIDPLSIDRRYNVYVYERLFNNAAVNAREVKYYETAEDQNNKPVALFRYVDDNEKTMAYGTETQTGIQQQYYKIVNSPKTVMYFDGSSFSGSINPEIHFVVAGYRFSTGE